MIEKNDNSVETFLVNVSSKNDTKLSESGLSLKEFNNVETADRKLIINKKYEFWVQDEILSLHSDYLNELFSNKSQDTNEVAMTNISVPHDKHILDILLWIYTKDSKKLKKASKTFQSFIQLISLGIHLKLRPQYFEILLTKVSFSWKESNFSDLLWSKTIFTFPILERIVNEMQGDKYIKLVGICYIL